MSKILPADVDLSGIRRWPTGRAKSWVESFVTRAANDSRVAAIVGVGSAVRVGVKSGDIDLLMFVTDPLERGPIRPPLEVDLRIYSAAEAESKICKGHDYLVWAIRYGVIIHEKNRFWSTIVSHFASRLPLPSAEIARERAKKASKHLQILSEIGDKGAALEQAVSMLTHLARAKLIEAGIYPASRPELPGQLEDIGHYSLAHLLKKAMQEERESDDLDDLLEELRSKLDWEKFPVWVM